MTATNPQDYLIQSTTTRYSQFGGSEYSIDIKYSSLKKSADGYTITSGNTTAGTIEWDCNFLNGLGEYVPFYGLFKVYENGVLLTSTANSNTPSTATTSWQWASSSAITPINNLNNLKIELYDKDDVSSTNLLDTVVLECITDGIAGSDTSQVINVVLSNDSHNLPSNSNGDVLTYAGSGTYINVYEGNSELVYDGTGAGTPSIGHYRISSITNTNITNGAVNSYANGVQIADSSYITNDAATISYSIYARASDGTLAYYTGFQSIRKLKSATPTSPYFLTSSTPTINRYINNSLSPDTITVNLYYISGTSNIGYNGYYKVLTSTDGSTYSTATATTTASSTLTYTITNSSLSSIKIEAYTTNTYIALLDVITVPLIQEGASGLNSDPFIVLLTNDSVNIPTDNIVTGSTANYYNSGTNIRVYEGGTELTYAGNTTAGSAPALSGSYYVKVLSDGSNRSDISSNITPGIVSATTIGGTAIAKVTDSTNISNVSASITYTILIKSIHGNAQTYIRQKTQTITAAKRGADGVPAKAVWINNNICIINATRDKSNYTPGTFTPNVLVANDTGPIGYSGRIRVLYDIVSAKGIYSYTAYSSTVNETATSSAINVGTYGTTINSFKIQSYAAGGFTTLIDEQIIPIVVNGQANITYGYTGDRTINAYVLLNTGTIPGSTNVVTTGATSLPYPGGSNPFGLGTTTWYTSVQTPSTSQTLWKCDGIYNYASNQITWTAPYIAYLKVGQLAAISADIGSITAGTITLGANGWIKGGKTSAAEDTNAGFFFGYESSTYQFKVGSSSQYIYWNGSSLTIAGQVFNSGNLADEAISNHWYIEHLCPYPYPVWWNEFGVTTLPFSMSNNNESQTYSYWSFFHVPYTSFGATTINGVVYYLGTTEYQYVEDSILTIPPSGGFSSNGVLNIIFQLRISGYGYNSTPAVSDSYNGQSLGFKIFYKCSNGTTGFWDFTSIFYEDTGFPRANNYLFGSSTNRVSVSTYTFTKSISVTSGLYYKIYPGYRSATRTLTGGGELNNTNTTLGYAAFTADATLIKK